MKPDTLNFRRIDSRRGMSLLEVMIATTLLLAAVMALSQVAFVARRHATGADERTQAQEIAQNIMEEILAGARPATRITPTTMEEDEQWIYMIQVDEVEGTTLARVTVQVDRFDPEEDMARMPTEDEMGGFRLVHWVRGVSTAPTDSTGSLSPASAGEEGVRE